MGRRACQAERGREGGLQQRGAGEVLEVFAMVETASGPSKPLSPGRGSVVSARPCPQPPLWRGWSCGSDTANGMEGVSGATLGKVLERQMQACPCSCSHILAGETQL